MRLNDLQKILGMLIVSVVLIASYGVTARADMLSGNESVIQAEDCDSEESMLGEAIENDLSLSIDHELSLQSLEELMDATDSLTSDVSDEMGIDIGDLSSIFEEDSAIAEDETISSEEELVGASSYSISNATAQTKSASYSYSGAQRKPNPTVILNGKTLVKDQDYTLAYKNNTNVGTATIIITGIGQYTGSKSITFKITAVSLEGADAKTKSASYVYTGSSRKPKPVVTWNGKTLVVDKDYTLAYANNTNVGTATITINGKGNFKGKKNISFTLTAASLTEASVSTKYATYEYTGKARKPAPIVILNGKTLVKDQDYLASYKNNTNPGTATITITGKNNYKGTAIGTFKLIKKVPITEMDTFEDFSKAAADLVKRNQTSNGDAIAANDEFYTKRLLVKSNEGASLKFDEYNPTEVLKLDNIYFVQFRTSNDARIAYGKICNLDSIQYVEPDSYVGAEAEYNYSMAESAISWGVSQIGADQYAEYLSTNTSSIKVAVVDSGVSNHAFLSGRIASGGYDFIDKDTDPADYEGHGTHVAGIIVACTPNLNVNILPVRVLNSKGDGYASLTGLGIRHAVDHGASIINLSLGGGHSAFKDDNIMYAREKGVTVVVAAGNDYGTTDKTCPAHIKEAIVVGAIDSNLKKADFSNSGNSLDVVAPGVDIVSCIPGGKYASKDGTSMATPHIAAAAAMLKLENPSYTPDTIEEVIKQISTDLGSEGWDENYGYGIPDLRKLIQILPTKIKLSKTSLTLDVGKTVKLKYTISPSNVTEKTVTWSSSNKSVATVSKGGVVTGKASGTATITVKTKNGKKATCKVTVCDPASDPDEYKDESEPGL